MQSFDPKVLWYHGSPLVLDSLLAGSTITQDKALARVFSHKPTIVCLGDELSPPRLRHNGALMGFLYIIDEPVYSEDVTPHPRTSMPPGLEWLTRRPLRVRLLIKVDIQPGELLRDEDIQAL